MFSFLRFKLSIIICYEKIKNENKNQESITLLKKVFENTTFRKLK